MKINVISCDNGVGLSRDVKIMTDLLLQEGHQVEFSGFADKSLKKSDMNLFVEIVTGRWLETAPKNILVPNPEWYDNSWMQFLPKFNMVLAKTRYAEDIFRRRGVNTTFTSFTSYDKKLDGVIKNDFKFFHLAGKSTQKGTEMIIRTWEKNPNFPPITILQDPSKWRRRVTTRNINHIYDRLDEHVLQTIQNAYGIHICPSETEGFGHYIMEGLSVKALVITTNGPPMNEIITPDRGILCEPIRKATQRLATNYYVGETTLERSVRTAMSMSDMAKERIRENGRKFFEENDIFFRKTFIETVNKVINS